MSKNTKIETDVISWIRDIKTWKHKLYICFMIPYKETSLVLSIWWYKNTSHNSSTWMGNWGPIHSPKRNITLISSTVWGPKWRHKYMTWPLWHGRLEYVFQNSYLNPLHLYTISASIRFAHSIFHYDILVRILLRFW